MVKLPYFKIGDKVVFIKKGRGDIFPLGTKAVITHIVTTDDSILEISADNIPDAVRSNQVIPVELYNSPLYKALYE